MRTYLDRVSHDREIWAKENTAQALPQTWIFLNPNENGTPLDAARLNELPRAIGATRNFQHSQKLAKEGVAVNENFHIGDL
jgi:hypothetical protein